LSVSTVEKAERFSANPDWQVRPSSQSIRRLVFARKDQAQSPGSLIPAVHFWCSMGAARLAAHDGKMNLGE
jgi:hypothetical protein